MGACGSPLELWSPCPESSRPTYPGRAWCALLQHRCVGKAPSPRYNHRPQLLPGGLHLWTRGSQLPGWDQRRLGGCTARCSTCRTLSGTSHDGVPRRPWERKTRDPSRKPASPSANLGNRQRQNRPLLSWRPGPELNNSSGDPEAPTAPLAIVLHKGPSDAVKESSGRRREDFCPPSDGGHQRQTEASGGMRYESQLWANGEEESPLTTFPHPLNPT